MTTIAYRRGVLAADTRQTDDAADIVYPGHVCKVFRLPDGSLFAAAGNTDQAETLKAALLGGLKTPRLKGVEAICVSPAGRVRIYEGHAWTAERAPFFALGTGKVAALAVMHAGRRFGAAAAVRIAMKLDFYSGGRVEMLRVRRRRQGAKRS